MNGLWENGRPLGKWTVQLGESGWSKTPKLDGPGLRWIVETGKSGRSTKVNGSKMALDDSQKRVGG